VTRGRNGSYIDKLHNRLHDINHPLPTITSHYGWGSTNGAQWILDVKGPRQLSIIEQAKAHNFSSQGIAWLLNMSKQQAQGYLARSIPVAFLSRLFESFLATLRQAVGRANRPIRFPEDLPCALEQLSSRCASLKISTSFPTLEEIIQQQHDEEDIEEVI
jgi:hypothetical protein